MQTNMNKTVIYKEDAIALLDNLENYIMELEGWQEKCDGVSQAKDLIADMPEVVYPLQSRWIYVQDRCGCELCRKCLSYDGNGVILDLSHLPFCPFCGAKMILEE